MLRVRADTALVIIMVLLLHVWRHGLLRVRWGMNMRVLLLRRRHLHLSGMRRRWLHVARLGWVRRRVEASLDQVLALRLRDERLQLGSGEGVDETGLADDEKQNLSSSECREFICLHYRSVTDTCNAIKYAHFLHDTCSGPVRM